MPHVMSVEILSTAAQLYMKNPIWKDFQWVNNFEGHWNLPHLYLVPPLGVTQFEFHQDLWNQKSSGSLRDPMYSSIFRYNKHL